MLPAQFCVTDSLDSQRPLSFSSNSQFTGSAARLRIWYSTFKMTASRMKDLQDDLIAPASPISLVPSQGTLKSATLLKVEDAVGTRNLCMRQRGAGARATS